MQTGKYFGDILIFLAMLIFATYALFLRFFPSIPIVWFLFAFQVVATIAFGSRSIKHMRLKGFLNNWNWITFALVCLANDLCLFYAYRLTSVANATISHQMVSFFLVLLSPIFLGEKVKKAEYIALTLSFIGILIIFSDGLSANSYLDLLGVSLGVLSGLFYAFILIGYIRFNRQNLNTNLVNFYRFALSTLLMAPFLPFFGTIEFNFSNINALVLFGFIFGYVAVTLHTQGIVLSRALHASIIGKTEPVIAIVYAYLFLSESIEFKIALGGILIIGSNIWLSVKKANLS